MSRLYDALKEASRHGPGADGNVADGMLEALGINEIHVPAVLNDPNVSKVSTAAGEADNELEAIDPYVSEDDTLDYVSRGLDGSFGISISTVLNPKARLMPHAEDPAVAEHYRGLRTKIMQRKEEKPFRSLLVTSATPQEGKTVTVLNLGLSFAMLPSFKVLVVDGDLRRGTLGNWLGVDHRRPGLSNLIDGSAQLEEVVLKSDEIPMHFMVRGNSQVPDLHSSQLDVHFQRMTEQYDLVLVDTPPVNLIADVQLLAASCDAVLVVARAFSTTRQAFEKAIRELLPFRVIGTVLNAVAVQRYGY
jgi:capsular exopolysaccharide synthesis family protein